MSTPIINAPDLWQTKLPVPDVDGHKYHRGHTVILGSEQFTGATRLAAGACSRVGSGLVTVHSRDQAPTYERTLPADIMIRSSGLDDINRPNVVLAGPGGCSDSQAQLIREADHELPLVLDADAIRLWPDLKQRPGILTPHAAEFDRYFKLQSEDRIASTLTAAGASGKIVILKGAQTLIAAPDGQIVLNDTASPYLAKAGTGDVLAGLVAGLLAQGMMPFDAACAGVWLHGRAGQQIGVGLIPQDIIAAIPALMQDLLS